MFSGIVVMCENSFFRIVTRTTVHLNSKRHCMAIFTVRIRKVRCISYYGTAWWCLGEEHEVSNLK